MAGMYRGAVVSGLAAAALVAAGCGSSGGSTGSSGSGSTSGNAAAAKGIVSTRQLSGIGTALVNGSGMTIYTPATPAEGSGKIACTGSCLSFWFPVTAGPASPAAGGLAGRLGTIRRPGGTAQLTYNGRPLYTFRLDKAAGQARGSNFTDSFSGTSFTWQVVTAGGQAGGAGSPAPSASYSYGSGY